MTRTERKALKRKVKRQNWISLGLILFVVLFLVTLFTTPLINLFRAPEGTELTDAQLLIRVSIMICLIIIPAFASMMFNRYADWNLRELYKEKNRLYKQQLRMYTEWLIQAVRDGDMERAKDLHDNFIWGSTKALTRGILLGYFFGKNIPEEQEKVNDHFSRIPDEVFERDK